MVEDINQNHLFSIEEEQIHQQYTHVWKSLRCTQIPRRFNTYHNTSKTGSC